MSLWTNKKKHREGLLKRKEKIDKFGNIYYKKKGVGGHSYEAVLEGKLKIKGETIPPKPLDDEPFIAILQMFDKTNPRSFVNKGNSSIIIKGKQNRAASTMFPKNWKNRRIEEEIAFAFKNKKFVDKNMQKDVLIEIYKGKSSIGMEIEFIFNNGILITTPPVLKLN